MGWTKTQELLPTDKRFEVDGANIARKFIRAEQENGNGTESIDEARIQRVWDAIALHATGSIARHAAPEVTLTHIGVIADFLGPSLRGPGDMGLITTREYEEIMRLFPQAGFNREDLKKIICSLCRANPESINDNWTGTFGRKIGTDGHGEGRVQYTQAWKEAQSVRVLPPALDALEVLEKTLKIRESGFL
ncbi:hypothetical protein BDV12DRAFT_201945 [Aspergillus spectabilis]